jgi:hypothetical protein
MCENGLNGILAQGLSNTLYYMFTQLQNGYLEFQSSNRTVAMLRSMLSNAKIVQIVDMKTQVLNPIFYQLNE